MHGSSASSRSTLTPNPSGRRPSFSATQSSPSYRYTTPSISGSGPLHPQTPQPELCNKATIYSKAGLFLEHLIAQGAVGDVWAGYMIIEGTAFRQRPVVAKMATTQRGREELLREGDIYRYLAKLPDGSFASRCYGVFDDTDGTTALIMDHLGIALKSFDNLGVQASVIFPSNLLPQLLTRHISIDSQRIYDEATKLHKIGVCHNDLEPRNVLIDRDGHAHIIDFHVSETSHKCNLPIGCDELQRLARRLGLKTD
jgi:Lipopolysaccharide kinase (Kdo/WaaP) family